MSSITLEEVSLVEDTFTTPAVETIDEKVEKQFNDFINSRRDSLNSIDSQQFTLYPNYVEMKLGGLKKSISLLDFKSIVDGLLQTEQTMMMVSLPFNCFSFAKSATEIQLSCYHPEAIKEVSHIDRSTNKTKNYKIPFPNVIISIKLKLQEGLWSVQGTKYFCTNKKVTQLPETTIVWTPDHANGIWGMPFPNFYAEGNMCYGRNTMPTKFTQNLRGLDYYYQVIFASPFNDDLGIGSVASRMAPIEWFKKLSKLTEFPYNELRK